MQDQMTGVEMRDLKMQEWHGWKMQDENEEAETYKNQRRANGYVKR